MTGSSDISGGILRGHSLAIIGSAGGDGLILLHVEMIAMDISSADRVRGSQGGRGDAARWRGNGRD